MKAYSEPGEQSGRVESSEALLSAFTAQLAEISGGLRCLQMLRVGVGGSAGRIYSIMSGETIWKSRGQ